MDVNKIALGGYTIEELKKMQVAVRKDAAAFMATHTKFVKDNLSTIIEAAEQWEEMEDFKPDEELAQQIEYSLAAIKTVSEISGVQYNLDYRDEHGYRPGDVPLGERMEEVGLGYNDVLQGVAGYLEDMEYQLRVWNTSTC